MHNECMCVISIMPMIKLHCRGFLNVLNEHKMVLPMINLH